MIAAAIRAACLAEASAAKVGNVHPGASFADLRFEHFQIAADIAAVTLTDWDRTVGARILRCVDQTVAATGTNVNLGIALLIGPLAEARRRDCPVGVVVDELDHDDGSAIFAAIGRSRAGGLGMADRYDVQTGYVGDFDVIGAMRLAKDRDRIALQYAGGFVDLFDNVVPTVHRQIERRGEAAGIVAAHVELLSLAPDSLIARKCGVAVAEEIRRRAAATDADDPASVKDLDDFLRRDGNRLNPGTTADLIAAALFWLTT